MIDSLILQYFTISSQKAFVATLVKCLLVYQALSPSAHSKRSVCARKRLLSRARIAWNQALQWGKRQETCEAAKKIGASEASQSTARLASLVDSPLPFSPSAEPGTRLNIKCANIQGFIANN